MHVPTTGLAAMRTAPGPDTTLPSKRRRERGSRRSCSSRFPSLLRNGEPIGALRHDIERRAQEPVQDLER